jgi:hypothetical protein
MIICEDVNEMRCIMANTMFNLYRGGLQEVGEVKRLEVILTKDEIAYHRGVEDASPSTSDLDLVHELPKFIHKLG